MENKKLITIAEIKSLTSESQPFYFQPKTLAAFSQSITDFKVYKLKDGEIGIIAPGRFNVICKVGFGVGSNKCLPEGKIDGYSVRIFKDNNLFKPTLAQEIALINKYLATKGE